MSAAASVRELLWARPDATCRRIARELGTSERTLRRRLEREGATFRAIADAVRREVAVDALSNPAVSIRHAAHRAGFSEASALYRAFRRWTGMTVGEWRARWGSANSRPEER